MGTPTSSTRVPVSIGGITCAIQCPDRHLLALLRERYQWFESAAPPDFRILLQVVPFSELPRRPQKGAAPAVSVTRAGDGHYLVQRFDNPFSATISTPLREARVRLWGSQYCFDSFLRVFYTLLLAEQGGLLVHASAISRRGEGEVFFGPSGSGKTTVARLSADGTVLTDELALIRPYDGEYQVWGTPFWGEFTPGRSNSRARLSALFALKMDMMNGIIPMERAAAVAELYRCVLFFGSETALLGRVLETCCGLVDSVPVYELHFRRDPSFWQAVDGRDTERRLHLAGPTL